MLTFTLYLLVLRWQLFKFKCILKDLYFLLSFPKFYVFDVIFNIFMFICFIHLSIHCLLYQLLLFSYLSSLYWLIKQLILCPYQIFAFPSEISPFLQILTFYLEKIFENISFTVGLVLMSSFNFCLSEKFFISSSIPNDNISVQISQGAMFSLSGL